MAASNCPSSSLSPPSPNKRRKTLSSSNPSIKEDSCDQESLVNEERCGICLRSYGDSIRGRLDCCDHFFCFVCIMQWAKTESRCPTCRRRFSSIHRPPKPGVFPNPRIVNIPIRDQVYHPYAHVDPYEDVQCSVCHGGDDDRVLLLCDLCDSAAHTYCVGLGPTVPEGDWFCNDCAASRTDHKIIQIVDDADDKFKLKNIDVLREADQGDVSAYDIVGESFNTPFISPQRSLSLHRVPCGTQHNFADEVTGPREINPQTGFCKTSRTAATPTVARTLSRCRNVNGYIGALRENWDAFRNGSLSFSSNQIECSNESDRNLAESLDQQHLSSSSTSQRVSTKDGFSGLSRQDTHSYDIGKSWKMMDRALNSIIRQASKYPSGKESSLKDPWNKTTKKQYMHYSTTKRTEKLTSPRLRKKRLSKVVIKEIVESDGNVGGTYSTGSSASKPSCQVLTNNQGAICLGNRTGILQENTHVASKIATNEKKGRPCMVGCLPGSSDSRHDFLESSVATSCNVYGSEARNFLENGSANSKARDDAKCEIQSLVKRNLKLLSRDKKLGVAEFKDVARHATHTVLAACGFGCSKYAIESFPSLECRHSVQDQQLQKSSLMPSSCQECFHRFVKDVVRYELKRAVTVTVTETASKQASPSSYDKNTLLTLNATELQ